MNTVNKKSEEGENFRGFHGFSMNRKSFLYLLIDFAPLIYIIIKVKSQKFSQHFTNPIKP